MEISLSSAVAVETRPASGSVLTWAAAPGFALFCVIVLVAGGGGLLRLAYPAVAFLVGLYLYRRDGVRYLSFTLWLWFLTPFVRRLIDYQSGWVDPSPVLLAPLLVTVITGDTFLRHCKGLLRQGGLPFALALAGVAYGTGIGMLRYPPTPAIVVAILNWVVPICFGFYLLANWPDYDHYRKAIERNFVWGTLVMGSYGVWQFIFAPAWDQEWMRNVQYGSFGTPEPFGIRVFSTLNSPGPFGVVMLVGLLLLFVQRGWLRLPAAAAGYAAFLLALVRSAWMGWLVGLTMLLIYLQLRVKIRLLAIIFIVALCVSPLFAYEPFVGMLQSRFQTFTSLKQDVSYLARMEGYVQFLGEALADPLGKGVGVMDKEYVIDPDDEGMGPHDSAILEILLSLGCCGALLYLAGLGLLLRALLRSPETRDDPFATAARAIGLAFYALLVMGSVIIAVSGVIFWGFLGIALAARRYHQQQLRAELSAG